jgi:hypothetical protein
MADPIPIGRAASWSGGEMACLCDDVIVLPDGRLKHCACPDSPIIGNVFDGLDDWPQGCYHEDGTMPESWDGYQTMAEFILETELTQNT